MAAIYSRQKSEGFIWFSHCLHANKEWLKIIMCKPLQNDPCEEHFTQVFHTLRMKWGEGHFV